MGLYSGGLIIGGFVRLRFVGLISGGLILGGLLSECYGISNDHLIIRLPCFNSAAGRTVATKQRF